MKVVRVEWQDITGHDKPWWEAEDVKGLRPAEITSIGVLVSEVEGYIIVAGSWEDDGALLGNVNCIPRGVIRKMEVIYANDAPMAPPDNHH
jgi:hypothetical protein